MPDKRIVKGKNKKVTYLFGGIENNSYICDIETTKERKYARNI